MTKSNRKDRLEKLLVERDLAADLAEAKALIMAGRVVVDDQRIDKPATMVSLEAQVRVKNSSTQFVSRAGDKLMGAFEDLDLLEEINGSAVLDIGSSTGGFTQACLVAGATNVLAVDVGTNQLDWRLRKDSRVQVHEKTDVREFSLGKAESVDWVVVDVSFISLRTIMDALFSFHRQSMTRYLMLVKPQFEVQKKDLPEGGVITNIEVVEGIVSELIEELLGRGAKHVQSANSRIKGREGNQEVFIYFELGETTGRSEEPN